MTPEAALRHLLDKLPQWGTARPIILGLPYPASGDTFLAELVLAPIISGDFSC